MERFGCSQEKSQYKMKRQPKPFIDRNLQLQLPEPNLYHSTFINELHNPNANPIYSHYASSSCDYLPLEINEIEIYQAMKEAESSYKAWKRMEQQIKSKINL